MYLEEDTADLPVNKSTYLCHTHALKEDNLCNSGSNVKSVWAALAARGVLTLPQERTTGDVTSSRLQSLGTVQLKIILKDPQNLCSA